MGKAAVGDATPSVAFCVATGQAQDERQLGPVQRYACLGSCVGEHHLFCLEPGPLMLVDKTWMVLNQVSPRSHPLAM